MSAIYTEIHFKGRLRSVAELHFQHCVAEGARPADIMEAGLDRVAKVLNGPLTVDGKSLDAEAQRMAILVTPVDRAGWCVAYASRQRLGENLIELLARPCPIEDGARTWEDYLAIEAAIHGYISQDQVDWGWVLRRKGDTSGCSQDASHDAPQGKDISSAFAAVGRLFGSVNLALALHRLINVSKPQDLEDHKLLWAERPASSV